MYIYKIHISNMLMNTSANASTKTFRTPLRTPLRTSHVVAPRQHDGALAAVCVTALVKVFGKVVDILDTFVHSFCSFYIESMGQYGGTCIYNIHIYINIRIQESQKSQHYKKYKI